MGKLFSGYKKNNLIFIIFFILLILIAFFSMKIFSQVKGKVQGIQQIAVIDKKNLIFDRGNQELLHFYELKPNTSPITKEKWLPYEVKNTYNSDGLNERYDYSPKKVSGVFRIIMLGDSFTYGYLVETAENYTELLEDMLNSRLACPNVNKFEVINLGVSGYDVTYTAERFKTRGLKYSPDLVIWLLHDINFKYNDYLLPLEDEMISRGATRFDTKTQQYTAHERVLKIVNENLGEDAMFNLSKKSIYKIRDIYDNNLLIVMFSFAKQKYIDTVKEFISPNPKYKMYTNLVNIYTKKEYYLLDRHPSKEGHKIIADDLFTYLRSHYFSNCNVR